MRSGSSFWIVVVPAFVLACGLRVGSSAPAHSSDAVQAAGGAGSPAAAAQAITPAQGASLGKPGKTPHHVAWQGAEANRLSQRAEMYYEGVWGVGDLRVKTAESGELIRFNYRILDPAKAAPLNDKKMEPELYDAHARVKLTVPQMEKVGKLRQESTPKAGMTYWMAFSNPTLAVKRGDRVDVVIGSFRATNLMVE